MSFRKGVTNYNVTFDIQELFFNQHMPSKKKSQAYCFLSYLIGENSS